MPESSDKLKEGLIKLDDLALRVGFAKFAKFDTALTLDAQGSRGGNPGLEVVTASRYLIRAFLQSVGAIGRQQRQTEVGRKG